MTDSRASLTLRDAGRDAVVVGAAGVALLPLAVSLAAADPSAPAARAAQVGLVLGVLATHFFRQRLVPDPKAGILPTERAWVLGLLALVAAAGATALAMGDLALLLAAVVAIPGLAILPRALRANERGLAACGILFLVAALPLPFMDGLPAAALATAPALALLAWGLARVSSRASGTPVRA